ncbi:MAG TPA: hypothetical protein VNF49_02445 [Candidatus Binataceae bacterium]|nr:hypothetical protein [Candidatus Binataceae bacterium]
MKIKIAFMMLGALLSVQTAQAIVAPILSGPYAVTLTDTCQAAIAGPTDPRTGDVQYIETFTTGKLAQTVGTLTFDPNTLIAQISATMIKGSLLIVRGVGGSHMATSTLSSSVPYSNTDSSLVIDTQTYHAAYGNIVSGVAQYVSFVGSKSPQCVERGVAVHE